MNNPFLKRLMKDKKEDVVHSSAYAKVQNSNGIGVASVETFSGRLAIEQNRQVVRGYGDSKIVNEARGNAPRAKKYEPPETSGPERRAIPPIRKNPGISR